MRNIKKVVVVRNNLVENIILKYEDDVTSLDVLADDTVQIGWQYLDGMFHPPETDKTKLLTEELAVLASEYEVDMLQFQRMLGTIMLTDGPNEATRIAALRTQWQARKTKYVNDIAVVRAKYN